MLTERNTLGWYLEEEVRCEVAIYHSTKLAASLLQLVKRLRWQRGSTSRRPLWRMSSTRHKWRGNGKCWYCSFGVSWPLEGASRWLIGLSPLLTFELLLNPPPTQAMVSCTVHCASFVINFDGRHVALSWSSASACDSQPGPAWTTTTRWQPQQLSKLFAGRLIWQCGQSFSQCRVPGALPKFSAVLIFAFLFCFYRCCCCAGPSMSAGKRQKAIKEIKNAWS